MSKKTVFAIQMVNDNKISRWSRRVFSKLIESECTFAVDIISNIAADSHDFALTGCINSRAETVSICVRIAHVSAQVAFFIDNAQVGSIARKVVCDVNFFQIRVRQIETAMM